MFAGPARSWLTADCSDNPGGSCLSAATRQTGGGESQGGALTHLVEALVPTEGRAAAVTDGVSVVE